MVPTVTSTSFNDTSSDTTTSDFPRLNASGSTFVGTSRPAVGGVVDRDYFMIDVSDGFRDGPGSLSTMPLRMTVQLSGSFPPGDTGTFAVEWGQITYKNLDFNGAVSQAGTKLVFNSFSSGTVELQPNWWGPNADGEPFVLYFSVSPAGYTGPYTISISGGTDGGGGSRPDFTAQADWISSTILDPGGYVNLTGRVANVGAGAGVPGRIGYFLSSDPLITTSDTFLADVNLTSALAAGGSIGSATGITLPTNLQAGTAYLGMIADYDAQIAESNEANNASHGIAVTIESITAPKPDLVVSAFRLDQTSTIQEGDVTATFTLTNQGPAASRMAVGWVVLSQDMEFGGVQKFSGDDDRGLGAAHLISSNGTLAAGSSASGHHAFRIPADISPGTYYVALVADLTREVFETNEGNNIAWLPITVRRQSLVPLPPNDDFDDDGKSDILWRNDRGALNVWSSTGTNFTGRDYGIVPTVWAIADTADFGGDGKSDILWRTASGAVNVWTSNGTNFTGRDFGIVPDAWTIQGAADVTGDGKADIVWRHNDGSLNVWKGTGTNFTGRDFGKVALSWTVEEIGDFNADGRADLLWRNDDGALNVWSSTGENFAGKAFGVVDSSWHIAEVADFNGDERDDILWRDTSGGVNVWTSTGSNFVGRDYGRVDPSWQIQSAADYTGDGKADILWRSAAGAVNVWASTGTNFEGRDYGIVDPGWHIA